MKKKTILMLLLSGIIFISCQSCQKNTAVKKVTKTADSVSNAATVTPPPVVTAPTADPFLTLTAQENLFDNIHYAYGSLGWNVTAPTKVAAANNQEVGTLNTIKGNVAITYTGRTTVVPAGANWAPLEMDGKIPILISDDGGPGKWLSFKNVTSTQYESAAFTGIAPPFEIWFVFRYMPGQKYEALFEGESNFGYVGDLSSSMRIVSPNYGTVSNSTLPVQYKTHIGRLVLSSQSSASWYLDGAFVGTVALQSPDLNSVYKTIFNVGVITHQSDWDFGALYFKKGAFSSTDATTIYNSLASKWAVGTTPNQILLDNIQYTVTNGTYTPFATVVNTPNGVTLAPPSSWDYQWYQDDGSLDNQKLFSTAYQPTTKALNAAYGTRVKVLIRPKDTNGNVWRFFEGTYP